MQLLDPFGLHGRAGQFGVAKRVGEGTEQLFLLARVEARPVGGKGAGDRGLHLGGKGAVVILQLRQIGDGYAQRVRHRRLIHAMIEAQLAQAGTCEDSIAACHIPHPILRS